MSQIYLNIKMRPHGLQFVAGNIGGLVCTVLILMLAGYDGLLPKSVFPFMMAAFGLLFINLLCKCVYLLRISYIITEEQLQYEYGILSLQRDFIELYRVVDYSEQRSFLQMLFGLKTVSIYSGDKTCPRLDIIGVKGDTDLKPDMMPSWNNASVKQWLVVSLMALILWVVSCQRGYSQIVTANPGEYTILATGNALINNTVKSETKAERETAVMQNAMAGEFTKMAEWERQYNSYLKMANGYASAIKAATHIYDDGVRILLTLNKLRHAATNNPQGIVATLDMNNLYMETVTEMVSVFTLLKNAVAKGGEQNMLTGSERSKTLWELEDKLSSFSHKLHLLYISIRHYRMADVWNRVTAGMIERNKGDIARQSLSHWRRYASEVVQYSH